MKAVEWSLINIPQWNTKLQVCYNYQYLIDEDMKILFILNLDQRFLNRLLNFKCLL